LTSFALPDTPRAPAGKLLAFFALSYGVTWAAFITVARWIPAETPAGYALVLLGTFLARMPRSLAT
jgi:hypothetical protein